jgi:hypothetical protein
MPLLWQYPKFEILGATNWHWDTSMRPWAYYKLYFPDDYWLRKSRKYKLRSPTSIVNCGGAKLPKKGPISLPSPQHSMRSPKVWAEYYRHELAREVKAGGMPPQEIFKIWVSEIAFPALWEHFLKISASQNKVLMVKFAINWMR